MSGGSYDYLCFKDAGEILGFEGQLRDMRDRLIGVGYAQDAARDTEEVLRIIRGYRARMECHLQALYEVWRSVEWWDSGDSGEDGVKKALSEYRGE